MNDRTTTERLRRPARARTIELGELRISYVPDGMVQLTTRGWLPDSTDEDWQRLGAYLDPSGHLVASIGALLIQHGDRSLLIDAGFGPYSVPAEPGNPHGAGNGGAMLENLEAIGCSPDSIEAIAFTHLHIDHVGWAWTPAPGSTEPAFSSARYLITEQEWAHRDLIIEAGTSAEALEVLQSRMVLTHDGEEIFPGVRVVVAPGHTSGHAAYEITSGGRRMIAFGDLMHTAVQVAHPDWRAASDLDGDQSIEHRQDLLRQLSEPDTIGFGVHFADVPFGRVEAADGGITWVPVD